MVDGSFFMCKADSIWMKMFDRIWLVIKLVLAVNWLHLSNRGLHYLFVYTCSSPSSLTHTHTHFGSDLNKHSSSHFAIVSKPKQQCPDTFLLPKRGPHQMRDYGVIWFAKQLDLNQNSVKNQESCA